MKTHLTPSTRQDANELLSIIDRAKSIIENPDFVPGDKNAIEQFEDMRQSVGQIQQRLESAM